MKPGAPTNPTTYAVHNEGPPYGATIIYQDYETCIRARIYYDELSSALEIPDPPDPTFWRLEVLDLPEFAEIAASDVRSWEYLIISLKGSQPHDVMIFRDLGCQVVLLYQGAR